jgi:ABC-type sugar transport system ATPase subunit
MISNAQLQVENLSYSIDAKVVLHSCTFSIHKGTCIGLMGETGSGKSTLLKLLAGLLQPENGTIYFNDERVLGSAEKLVPGHAKIAYLSQHFELPKSLRVEQVLSYANTLDGNKALRLFSLCKIDHILDRRTDQLSGGEKQRVAICKLLLAQPEMLLLDEPFTNLDAGMKQHVKEVIDAISKKLGITILMISHDAADILPRVDTLMILRKGKVIQQGTPEELYYQPKNEYVAALTGNYVKVTEAIKKVFRLKDENMSFIRPESFALVNKKSSKAKLTSIKEKRFFGNYFLYDVLVSDQLITVQSNEKYVVGEKCFVFYRGS